MDYARNRYEVIIVDDGSVVSLEPIVTSFQDGMQLRLVRQSNAGPAAARNNGALAARGKFLAFTDDDCLSDPSWLKALAEPLQHGRNRMAGGRVVNALSENIFSCASQLILDIVYAHYNADPGGAAFFASNNMAVAADAFRALGGFDPAFRTSEDRDLCSRWRESGFEMVFAPDAVIRHASNLTLKAFWNQHMSYGRGAFLYNRAHSRRGGRGSTLKYDFYTSLPRRFIDAIGDMQRFRVFQLVLLMVLWQTANAVGFSSRALHYLTNNKPTTAKR